MDDLILMHIAAGCYMNATEVEAWLEQLPPMVGEKFLEYCIGMQEIELEQYYKQDIA